MNFLTPDTTSQVGDNAGFSFLSLENAADWANVVVAAAAFFLSLCTYIRQRKLDRENQRKAIEEAEKAKLEAERLRERNLDFQLYKEFAIAPNINHLHEFYIKLYKLQETLKAADITDTEKMEVNRLVREATREVRDTLLSAIRPFGKDHHDAVWNKIDEISELVLQMIINDDHKLSKKATFDKIIGAQIEKSKHEIHALLYKYKGVSSVEIQQQEIA